MPRDFIKIDRSTTTATQATLLFNLVQQLRVAKETATEIKAIMDHNTDNSVWTDIETLFGVPSGQGQTVYNLVSGGLAAMNGTATDAGCKTLIERVG